jgi:hypothetical protein
VVSLNGLDQGQLIAGAIWLVDRGYFDDKSTLSHAEHLF